MAVAVGDSAAILETAATYTAAAGSNRLLVAVIGAEDLTSLTSLVFGGITMTVGQALFGGNGEADVYAYYLKDADIPSGSQSLVITQAGASWTTDEWSGHIYTLTGVDQTTPIGNKVAENGNSATTWTVTSITSITDGILLALGVSLSPIDAGSTITTASWTTDSFDADAGGGGLVNGNKLITSGASEGVTFDWNGGSESGAAMLMSVLPGAASENTTITIPTGPWY